MTPRRPHSRLADRGHAGSPAPATRGRGADDPAAPEIARRRRAVRRLRAAAALTLAGAATALAVTTAAAVTADGQAARTGPGVASTAPSTAYRLPLDRPGSPVPDVARPFDAPATRWAAGHRGVDLAASPEEDVLAPGPGVVTFAGAVAGRGVVTVQHPDGRRSSVEPVAPTVRVGERVVAGAPLGALQDVTGTPGYRSHCAPGSCLHWGVRVRTHAGEEYVDPMALLPGAGPVVLLPADAELLPAGVGTHPWSDAAPAATVAALTRETAAPGSRGDGLEWRAS